MFWMNVGLSVGVGIVGVMACCGTLMLPMLLDDEESPQKRPKAIVAVSEILLAITCLVALVVNWVFDGGIAWLLLPGVPLALVMVGFSMASKES